MSEAKLKPFRPMLAFDADINYYADRLTDGSGGCFWVSPKMDGIRAMVIGGRLLSRTMKPIRNVYTQKLFGDGRFEGLDGELIVGDPMGEGVFARTTSGVMSADGEPNVWFHVFDNFTDRSPFLDRHKGIHERRIYEFGGAEGRNRIQVVQQNPVYNAQELEVAERTYVDLGYEGIILKHPMCPYKQGRSTPKEGYMGKLKRLVDSEAIILGFEEMMHNDNPATTDARGFTARSSHQAGWRPSGMLGALRVRDATNEAWVFGIGSGFDHELRQKIWADREAYTGKIVRYKYLPIGTLDAPRQPIFTGFRDPMDIG